MLASLWWAKVFSRCRSAWSGTTGLLNAQCSAFDNLTLKSLLGSISLLSSDHLYETETTGLLGMGVKHDLALFNIAIFLEETGDLCLGKTGMNSGDEQVGTWVDCAIILGSTTVVLGRATIIKSEGEKLIEWRCTDRLSAPFPPGEADRRGPPRGLSLRRAGRGDALRSRS